ncbi:hypothetical protein B0H11DRAFT_2379068, partial [Mycena galericulata]
EHSAAPQRTTRAPHLPHAARARSRGSGLGLVHERTAAPTPIIHPDSNPRAPNSHADWRTTETRARCYRPPRSAPPHAACTAPPHPRFPFAPRPRQPRDSHSRKHPPARADQSNPTRCDATIGPSASIATMRIAHLDSERRLIHDLLIRPDAKILTFWADFDAASMDAFFSLLSSLLVSSPCLLPASFYPVRRVVPSPFILSTCLSLSSTPPFPSVSVSLLHSLLHPRIFLPPPLFLLRFLLTRTANPLVHPRPRHAQEARSEK